MLTEGENDAFHSLADYFNSCQVARTEAAGFRELQEAVTRIERRLPTLRHGIVTHHGCADCIRADRIQARNQHARRDDLIIASGPRTLAAGHGCDAVDDGEVHRASGTYVHDNARHTIVASTRRFWIELLRSAIGRGPRTLVHRAAAAGFCLSGRLVLARRIAINRNGRRAKHVLHAERDANGCMLF